MINCELFETLVNANIVTKDTEVNAYYKGKDIGGDTVVQTTGTFVIVDIQPATQGYKVLVASTVDGVRRILPSTAIFMIDGMDPARLAGTYGFSATGNTVKQGKRRGRKPKLVRDAV